MRCGMRERLRLMRCVLRTIRNDAYPRTFRTLADLDYRDTLRLNCRDASPPRMLCTLHTLSRAASVHAHALYPTGDVPEYNISTCILERLANPTACIVVERPLRGHLSVCACSCVGNIYNKLWKSPNVSILDTHGTIPQMGGRFTTYCDP
jgi:hypothetical protein